MTRVVAFDNPDPRVENLPFEKRYAQIGQAVLPDHPFLVSSNLHSHTLSLSHIQCFVLMILLFQMVSSRVRVRDKHHLFAATRVILRDGGEGVILRRPNSLYERGRSTSLIKFKVFLFLFSFLFSFFFLLSFLFPLLFFLLLSNELPRRLLALTKKHS